MARQVGVGLWTRSSTDCRVAWPGAEGSTRHAATSITALLKIFMILAAVSWKRGSTTVWFGAANDDLVRVDVGPDYRQQHSLRPRAL